MEQVLAQINYLIRERLWCSIKRLSDLVNLSLTSLGNEKRSRPDPHLLEGLCYLPRRQHYRSHQRTHPHLGAQRSFLCVWTGTHLLSRTMQKHRLGDNRHNNLAIRREGESSLRQRLADSFNLLMAHLPNQESRSHRVQGH